MTLRPDVVLAILAMALVTFAVRAGGYVVFRAVRPSAAMRRWLEYIPGTLFVAYVAPALAQGRWPEWVGGAATVIVMVWTRELAAAILAGTGAAWVVYSFL